MIRTLPELNPPPRLIMGTGPLAADPRVLRALSMPLLGQWDPAFTDYMNETMELYRAVLGTANQWTMVINGTARSGIEALLCSILEPGDRVLVPIFGRFGDLMYEIGRRCGADVRTIQTDWGTVFTPEQIEAAVREHRPKLVPLVHGDTSTTTVQPLAGIGRICRRYDAMLLVDATASLGGMEFRMDDWEIDAVAAGLQKCLSGPPGAAPISFNDRVAALITRRRHIERGLRPAGFVPGDGPVIMSNYLDLAMLMDYWGEGRLAHHTEAVSMLYAARECARIFLQDGPEAIFARHRLGSRALGAGIAAMGLQTYGDPQHRMPNVTGVVIPDGVDGDGVRRALLRDFGLEIATSFGPLHGRIWRIGHMGYSCRKENILMCLAALEATLLDQGVAIPPGQAVQAALQTYRAGERS